MIAVVGMQRNWLSRVLALGLLFGAASPSSGLTGEASEISWQERRLHQPNSSQRQREVQGQVFIYDGLTYGAVAQAMDEHFDRIENMMFTQIRHPAPPGGGAGYVEEDGCE